MSRKCLTGMYVKLGIISNSHGRYDNCRGCTAENARDAEYQQGCKRYHAIPEYPVHLHDAFEHLESMVQKKQVIAHKY